MVSKVNDSNNARFVTQASGWTDLDLPLQYAFSRVSRGVNESMEEANVLQQYSEMTATLVYLGPGAVGDGYSVKLLLMVCDVYGAESVSNIETIVPPTSLLASTQISSMMEMASTGNSTDSLLQWNNYAVTILKFSQCTITQSMKSNCLSTLRSAVSTSISVLNLNIQ